jgi:hypothetical protein
LTLRRARSKNLGCQSPPSAARLITDTGANRNELEIQFEESASDELISLGLNE